jgi:hypothetical protein
MEFKFHRGDVVKHRVMGMRMVVLHGYAAGGENRYAVRGYDLQEANVYEWELEKADENLMYLTEEKKNESESK